MLPSSRFAGRSPNPALAGRSPFANCTRRSIQADGQKIAPGVRNARAAPSPATLRALPNRALYPDCARTHRHGRHRVARPWALERVRRHQPLPHPLGLWRARHRVVAELHSALHRPFQESASTRPVGRACAPKRPRTNAAVPINRLDRGSEDLRWPCPALRETLTTPSRLSGSSAAEPIGPQSERSLSAKLV